MVLGRTTRKPSWVPRSGARKGKHIARDRRRRLEMKWKIRRLKRGFEQREKSLQGKPKPQP